jgi:hypothetical protein
MTKWPLNFRFGPENQRVLKTGLWSLLLLYCAATVHAGYKVEVQVDTAPGTNRYIWTVHNEDQSWGLDQFFIEVPVQTHVLAFTVPQPFANPDGNARWIMLERQEPWIDAHDGRMVSPSPRVGWKWLTWWGLESPSVYPAGSTAVFSVTTDSSVNPGVVNGLAATYTPQNNPHYYLPWQVQTTGPSISERTPKVDPISILAGPVLNPVNGHTYYLLAQNTWNNAEAQAVRLGGHLATIRNAQEDRWVYSTFGPYGGALWIGLTDLDRPFSFRWTSGEPVGYTNWGGGQPSNTGGAEYYVHIWPPHHSNPPSCEWNDYVNADMVLGFPLYGVAEIAPAATQKLELSASSNRPQAQWAAIPTVGIPREAAESRRESVQDQKAAMPNVAAASGPNLQAFTAIELSWPSEANKTYRVQWTSLLEQPRWIDLEPLVIGTGANVSIFDSTREHPQGFYRVQIVQ